MTNLEKISYLKSAVEWVGGPSKSELLEYLDALEAFELSGEGE